MSVAPAIRRRALLAYVSISCWSARKLDRKSTSRLVKQNNATEDAARVNKYLLANADEQLKALQKLAGKARRVLEDNSLPWDDAGNRMLSNEKALSVIGEIHALEHEFSQMVDEFVQNYPVMRAEAMSALGDLASDEDYPQPDVVRQKFSMRLALQPLPENFEDNRLGLSDREAKALQAHYEANVRAQTNRALMSAWTRLRDDVARMVDRLGEEDGKPKVFRNTLVQNLRDTSSLLASLNVFGDKELDDIRAEVELRLCANEADELRDNRPLATSVQSSAAAILSRIDSILGE